jgi:hypothetical protein
MLCPFVFREVSTIVSAKVDEKTSGSEAIPANFAVYEHVDADVQEPARFCFHR